MEWRCEWCEKPHAEDDPPCRSCGHGTFERAVVPEPEPVDTGPTYVWACTECDREHVKNSPPCSRCGNPHLAKTEQTFEDVERDLDTPSWVAVAKPYSPIIVGIVLVFALFGTGVVSPSILPGIGGDDVEMPDAPGDDEIANGLDLGTVETAVFEGLEAERRSVDAPSRERHDDVDDAAEFSNKVMVLERHGGEYEPPDEGSLGLPCSGDSLEFRELLLRSDLSVDDFENESALADAVVDQAVPDAPDSVDDELTVSSEYEYDCIDVHVEPDGAVSVGYAAC